VLTSIARYSDQSQRKRGLSHLVTVFNWLRENHVEKIVKVMVIDDADPSHSDASIEEALHDFGIEIWDWKKLDLSTDVIWRATTAPGDKDVSVVREISLYSTGNNAVLMGWASPQGLTNKKKFPTVSPYYWFLLDSTSRRIINFYAAQKGEPVHPRGKPPGSTHQNTVIPIFFLYIKCKLISL
jgi:hypothetical protein